MPLFIYYYYYYYLYSFHISILCTYFLRSFYTISSITSYVVLNKIIQDIFCLYWLPNVIFLVSITNLI
ncbi:hypothetical protein [Orientia tsutsugamushi]|uniref:hypothetical protein n=1 Tax=Orientia tsutsugamushi TaxID=784 RepID=UPI0013A53DBA|nr:hypothetical protein [Orientia tsutsugamushi]